MIQGAMSDEAYAYEEHWALLEERPTKRKQAKASWQQKDVYASRRAHLRHQKIAVFQKEEAGCHNEGVGDGLLPVKMKKPEKSKVNRLHSFHRQAFGAWLDCDLSAKRDRWTKLNRRYDGGALEKEQFLQDQSDLILYEHEKLAAERSSRTECPHRGPHHYAQKVKAENASAASLASLAGVGVLAKLWPASRVVQGMRVCKWVRAELFADAEHVVLSSVSKAVRKEEMAWAKMCGKLESMKCFTTAPEHGAPITENFAAVRSLEITYALHRTTTGSLGRNFPVFSLTFSPWGPGAAARGGMVILRSAMQAPHCLVHLDLRGCDLQSYTAFEEIEGLRFCSKLRHLNLADNSLGLARPTKLAALGSALVGMGESLEHLDLSLNFLDANGFSALAAGIAGLKQLQFLSLLAHDTSYLLLREEGAAVVASAVAHCPRMQHLELSNNQVGDAGVVAVATALAKCEELRHIGLQLCWLETAGALKLGDILKGLCLYADLARNPRLDSALLLRYLQRHQARWVGLDLSRTAYSAPFDFAGYPNMSQAGGVGHLRSNGEPGNQGGNQEGAWLVSLDLGEIRGAGVGGALELRYLCRVQRLSLRGAELGSGGLGLLVALLERTRALKHLDLRGCLLSALDNAGSCATPMWERLTAAMGALPALQCLHLGDNLLGAKRVSVLAAEAQKGGFAALERLGLGGSELRDEVRGVGEIIMSSPALSSLDLSRNGIESHGVGGLVLAIGKRKHQGWPALCLNFRYNPRHAWKARVRYSRGGGSGLGGHSGWKCQRTLVQLLGGGGLSGLELSRGDPQERRQESESRERQWDDVDLACWVLGWREWSYSELKAKQAIAAAAANGLRIYAD